jgi:hypothetical protein
MLTLALATDPPVDVAARELSGYRRPLDGEAANLTLILDLPVAARADWTVPPLGVPVSVYADGSLLLEGTLAWVKWTMTDISVGVEG